MATLPVKHFHSGMTGSPVLSGTPGGKIAVLDACLVNGFNLITLDSLVVSAGVLTGTKAGHGFIVDQVIATSATEASLTGEWVVTSVTSSTFSADATGVSNVTGTGTRTAKAAPAGWTKVYSGTNKAVYRGAVTGTNCLLRIDDTGTTTCRVVSYETMTDVDTGSGPFPTVAQASGGGYWHKSASADATARGWALVADSNMFSISRNHSTTVYSFDIFGDYPSEKAGEAFNCLLQCALSAPNMANWGVGQLGYANFTDGSSCRIFSPRSYNQLGSAVQMLPTFTSSAATAHSGTSSGVTYPSIVSNGLMLSPITLKEASSTGFRCLSLTGVYASPQALPLTHLDKVSAVAGLYGRKVMAMAAGMNSLEGRLFFDITGPWR